MTEAARRPLTVAELGVIADRAAASGLFGVDANQIFTLCLLAEAEGLHTIDSLVRLRRMVPSNPTAAPHDRLTANAARVAESPVNGSSSFDKVAREAQAVVDIQQKNPEPYVERFPEAAREEGQKQASFFTPAPTARDQHDEEAAKLRKRPEVERLLKEMTRGANDFWVNWQVTEGVVTPKELLTVFQVENHLGSKLIEDGVITGEAIEGPGGKRNRLKQLEVLEKCHRKNREKFDAMVAGYFAKLMEEGAAAAGILAPYDDRDAEPAEEVSATP